MLNCRGSDPPAGETPIKEKLPFVWLREKVRRLSDGIVALELVGLGMEKKESLRWETTRKF
jgi:hypothetical protein